MFWVYLLLGAGLFMGWSLGTNDAANAFGTAVSTRVVKYRTAVIIIAVMVLLGAILMGHNNIGKLSGIATSNKVVASVDEVDAAIEAGTLGTLRLKSALKAAIIFLCAALTVFVMSYLKFPVSANQSITGAVIGWGAAYIGLDAFKGDNLMELLEFASTWLINPIGAALISFCLVFISKRFIEKRLTSLKHYDAVVKTGYIVAGALSAFSIGQNSAASVTAFYYDATGKGANLFSDSFFTTLGDFLWPLYRLLGVAPEDYHIAAIITATVGGIAIAVGVLTFSRRVMETVGDSIANITQVDGFLVIIAMALTVLLMGKLMGIPVSTSQSVVGAVIGAGLVSGVKNVHFGVMKNIGIAWISSPLSAGILAFLVGIATKGYFGA